VVPNACSFHTRSTPLTPCRPLRGRECAQQPPAERPAWPGRTSHWGATGGPPAGWVNAGQPGLFEMRPTRPSDGHASRCLDTAGPVNAASGLAGWTMVGSRARELRRGGCRRRGGVGGESAAICGPAIRLQPWAASSSERRSVSTLWMRRPWPAPRAAPHPGGSAAPAPSRPTPSVRRPRAPPPIHARIHRPYNPSP
jgi:hypothetical protein